MCQLIGNYMYFRLVELDFWNFALYWLYKSINAKEIGAIKGKWVFSTHCENFVKWWQVCKVLQSDQFFDKTTSRIVYIGGYWCPVPPSRSFGHLQGLLEHWHGVSDHLNQVSACISTTTLSTTSSTISSARPATSLVPHRLQVKLTKAFRCKVGHYSAENLKKY